MKIKPILRNLIVFSLSLSITSDIFAQKWKKSKPETLYARNKKKKVTPVFVGIGTKSPTALLHTTGSLRFEGLTSNNNLNTVVAVDANGNVFWRDISNTISNSWFLNGNTISATHFFGTTNNQDIRIRTNNTQRAVITSAGLVGVGISVPTAQLHTSSSVRFEGLTNDNTLTRLVSMDNNGNLFWKDVSSLNSNSWLLNGNSVTGSSFLGTTNLEDIRFRVNNIQRAVLTNNGSLGIGVLAPTSQLHTNGSIRFEGIANDNSGQRLVSTDNNGNLSYRDVSSLQSQFWSLSGNSGTNPNNNFLGTTDNNRIVFRTNNTEKMTILTNGRMGIGVTNPQASIHVTNGVGSISGFPYEAAVFEKTGDSKLAVLSSDNTGVGGAAITLGHSNFSTGGLFPGYEMQYGFNNQRYLRFNYLPRNSSGVVQNEVANILVMTDNSRVGVNLGPTGGGPTPNFPTANFHTNGTVRHEGLTNGSGNPLVVDANGNVFVGAIGSSNQWNLTGNSGTNPLTNFLGTIDNNRLVFRTNNTEKVTILPNGRMGIGVTNPQASIHVTNSTGAITGYPYEAAIFEKTGDSKLALFSSDNTGVGGASITLGHSNFSSGGLFPGYEMQYGFNNQRYLRFNYLPRNSSGVVQNEVANIFIMTDNSRVGVNLGPSGGGGAPNFPSANLHTNGSVRFQNLPTGTGNALVMDANGNVFKSATLTGRGELIDLQEEIENLKKEIQALKLIVNTLKGGSLVVELTDNAVLFQNAPNPFRSSTTIRFYIPENIRTAFIQISSLQGSVLKSYSIKGGEQQFVTINAGELSAGTYIYTLFTDGKKVDSKKMILTR